MFRLSTQPLKKKKNNTNKNTNMVSDENVNEFLARLTPEERKEALAAAAAAQRAEERAEQRALEQAIQEKEEIRRRDKIIIATPTASSLSISNNQIHGNAISNKSINKIDVSVPTERVVFVPKRIRQRYAKEEEEEHGVEKDYTFSLNANSSNSMALISSSSLSSQKRDTSALETKITVPKLYETKNRVDMDIPPTALTEKERLAVKETYLGKSAAELEDEHAARRKKHKLNKKTTFKFRWDNTDDTYNAEDPLYANQLVPVSHAADVLQKKKADKLQKRMGTSDVASIEMVRNKPLTAMTARDWRIFRENYEITVKGGTAPPPMRSFRESPASYLPTLHPALLDAIENVLHFQEPSPIQRQAIPIGLQRRDLIGIAETGSGKTVAFGVPLCHYLLNLPERILGSVADEGPLALVMAPTRELALQIDVELQKLLARQQIVRSCAIVGGQPIQQQAQEIRKGVHIIVGTPGRINDCIEQAYLVLNQCCYIVLDEADRMVDMGFLPQMESM